MCDRGRQGEDDTGKGVRDSGCQRWSWYYIIRTFKSQFLIENPKQGFLFSIPKKCCQISLNPQPSRNQKEFAVMHENSILLYTNMVLTIFIELLSYTM